MRLQRQAGRIVILAALLVCLAPAQVIEFESGGLTYQTLTKDGLTIMFAHMPSKVREYNILQVAVSNGSEKRAKIKPGDFQVEVTGGSVIQAVPAAHVINQLIRNASSDDVIKLVTTYEMGLYGMGRVHSPGGYEKRRQAALAVVSSKRLKAAAAASAIAFVEIELRPGETTDGAVFYPTFGRQIDEARLRVYAEGKVFEFNPSSPSASMDH
jgi:hypothetical protein